jgi:hypothetical protein
MKPWLCGALAGVALAAGAQETRDAAGFAQWRQAHAAPVQAFEQFLAAQRLEGLVPLDQLLRSASDWQVCQAEPYAVPPEAQWPAVQQVLELVRELVNRGVLGPFDVHSGYRDAVLNECAGGAKGSAHLRAFAIDLTPRAGPDPAPGLCAFWRREGAAWRMGLSRYPSGRIHIDTAGHRTWGADHTGQSAFCGAE